MSLLSLQNITHHVGTRVLFEKVSFNLDEDTRIGLVGLNGCGKSTLLRIMAGTLASDDGSLVRRRGARIALVEQHLHERLRSSSVFDAIAAGSTDYVDRPTTGYLVDEWLTRLEFPEELWDRPVAQLSGGWLSRLLFARALAARPDLLILDEPTNHMDTAAIEFFERFLLDELELPFCLVSHDRTLLDRCTTRTAFLRGRRLAVYDQPYSAAREAMVRDELALAKKRADEEREIKRLESAAKILAHWGKVYDNEGAAKRARSMGRRIERMREELPVLATDKSAAIRVDAQDTSARFVLQVRDAVVSPVPGVDLFRIAELAVRPGERIAVLGANGAGKTTLLARLVRELRAAQSHGTSGAFRFNPQVTLGYFDQQLDTLPAAATLYGYLRDAFPRQPDATLRAELIAAGFAFERLGQTIATLSGGERARLQLLYLRLLRPSLLILDEPTNHIDVEGCESLERELLESGATCIMVSHDRRFIANVATRLVQIEGGALSDMQSAKSKSSGRSNPVRPAALLR